MNREHEFRGQRIDNGEWVYGFLYQLPLPAGVGCMILTTDNTHEDNSIEPKYHLAFTLWVDLFPVKPYTVGEFTGMTDKHGVKVFEGDIVDVYDFTSVYASKYRGVVKMYRGSWCVEYEDSILDMVAHPRLFFDDFADRKTEVIGNIHNNPELLSTK